MNAWRIVSVISLAVLLLIGCRSTGNRASPELAAQQDEDYDSIEGLWVSTDETSWHSGPDTARFVLHFRRDAQGTLGAQGCTARNGDYHMSWKLAEVQYDEPTRRITILDADGHTLIGFVDDTHGMIDGSVHLQDGHVNPLSFVRFDDDRLAARLFYPRLPDDDGNLTYTYRQPDQLDDGLTTSAFPDADARAALSRVIERVIDQEYGHIESLLVLQDGELVVEEYFFQYDREQPHRINSCTKSVASLLLGIALANHPDVDVGQPVISFFPEYEALQTPETEAMTLGHALTMTAGFAADEDSEEVDDWVRSLLSRPLQAKPGSTFYYDNGCTNLICGVIQRLERKAVHHYAEEFLFAPLGITAYRWEIHDNGMAECASGLELRPRDMAKIGLLVLNDGMWQGRQIVPAEWIRLSTRPHVVESEYYDYGYQWWYRSNDKKPWWKERSVQVSKEPDLFTAMGAGGQFITVIRERNMVVVTTASDYGEHDDWLSKIPMIVERIVVIVDKVPSGQYLALQIGMDKKGA